MHLEFALLEVVPRAAAAVRALRRNPAVRGDAVGILGSGNATWIRRLVAASDPKLAFLIALSGGPAGLAEQELHRRKQILAADDYDPANVERGGSAVWLYLEYLRSDGKRRAENLHEDYRRYRWEPWFPLLGLPKEDPTVSEWPETRGHLAAGLRYDPILSFAALRLPVLALLGSEDRVLPAPAAARLYQGLRKTKVTVQVIEGADRELRRHDDPGRIIPGREFRAN